MISIVLKKKKSRPTMAGSNKKSINKTTYSSNHTRNNKIQTSGRDAAYTYLALAIFFIFLSFMLIIRLSGANEPDPSSNILSAGEEERKEERKVEEGSGCPRLQVLSPSPPGGIGGGGGG